MPRFVHVNPAPDAYWRAVILFGRNTASYKFALGEALLALAADGRTAVQLDELAVPFARAVCRHLAHADRQGSVAQSRFLDACRRHARGELAFEDLVSTTRRLGFVNVIDAFHRVGEADVGVRFFDDDRARGGGVVLTDAVLALRASADGASLPSEVEARWRLVETAWNLGIAAPLLDVGLDAGADRLVVAAGARGRIDVTSSRDALNGYQRGTCFYCAAPVSPVPGDEAFADVDHFYPAVLAPLLPDANLNGVWNLVLACRACNRGAGGKFDRVAHLDYVERLARRNDYLIESQHPLRQTLMRQAGRTAAERFAFLSDVDRRAVDARGVAAHARWRAPASRAEAF